MDKSGKAPIESMKSIPRKKEELRELQKLYDEMETKECGLNSIFLGSSTPLYEEDMSHKYWMKKKQLQEKIRKLKSELNIE